MCSPLETPMKIGRNDPCPCGSGKKYKRCCMHLDQPRRASAVWRRMERLDEKLGRPLTAHAERFYGPDWLAEAWHDFTFGNDALFDEDPFADALDDDTFDEDAPPHEFAALFTTWCTYTWIPVGTGVDPEDRYPPMPVGLHYLEHRGARVDAFTRRFIEAACAAPFSFFMVRDMQPGPTITLRDVLRRRDYEIHGPAQTPELPRGTILYARVVTLDGDSILLGCAPCPMPPACAESVIDLREEWGIEADAPAGALAGRDAELRSLYVDFREDLFDPGPQRVENEDGDPVQLITVDYDLRCAPQDACDALLPLAGGLDGGQPRETDDAGQLVAVTLPWVKEGATSNDLWADTTLGQIRIDGPRLQVFVNSARRAATLHREVEARLGDRAAPGDTFIADDLAELPDWVFPELDPEDQDEMDADAAEDLLEEVAERHWEGWLDEPLPELKDTTLREAARTEVGRERLEALLWQLDQENADTVFDADTGKLRRALGLDREIPR